MVKIVMAKVKVKDLWITKDLVIVAINIYSVIMEATLVITWKIVSLVIMFGMMIIIIINVDLVKHFWILKDFEVIVIMVVIWHKD